MSKKEHNKWLVIVNPNAGRRKIEKDWDTIAGLLDKAGFHYFSVFTDRKSHAINLTKDYIEKGFKKIIVVGGDGTINEVVNGIFRQKTYPATDITLGMINVGTGNDWGRMYNISPDYKKAVKTLIKEHTYIQDAGHVKYRLKGEEKERYFVNMAGMGYDALVARKTNEMKEKGRGGPFAYLINLFTGLLQYKSTFFEIDIDDKRIFEGNVFSMSLGICKYNGGGMMQLPYAIPNDGLMDVTVIKMASKLKVIRNIKNLYDGSFVKLPEVETYTGKKVKIISRPSNTVFLETDGESLGHSPLEFSVIPQSIKLIVSKKFLRSLQK